MNTRYKLWILILYRDDALKIPVDLWVHVLRNARRFFPKNECTRVQKSLRKNSYAWQESARISWANNRTECTLDVVDLIRHKIGATWHVVIVFIVFYLTGSIRLSHYGHITVTLWIRLPVHMTRKNSVYTFVLVLNHIRRCRNTYTGKMSHRSPCQYCRP